MPLASHVAYWNDSNVIARIIEANYVGFTKSCKTNKPYDDSKEYFNKIWHPSIAKIIYFLGQAFLFMLLIGLPFFLWCFHDHIFSVIKNLFGI